MSCAPLSSLIAIKFRIGINRTSFFTSQLEQVGGGGGGGGG